MSPEAEAKASAQSVTLGETITLSAAGSDPKNGDPLTYRWSIVSAPVGSTAQIAAPTAVETTFTPDMVGDYVFSLVVDNDFHKSDPVEIKIRCVASGQPLPVSFATDATGTITLWDLTAIENSRTAERVNFSLSYSLENSGTSLANVSVSIFGRDINGTAVYSQTITGTIDPGKTIKVGPSLGATLTIAEYDSVATWTADPITVTP